MAYKVFISSTSRDIDLARDLAQRLDKTDAKVSLSSAEAASNEEPVITGVGRALREADEVILILTNNAVNNSGVLFDMGAAFSMRKRVTPVVIGVEPDDLPPVIKQMPYVKYGDLQNFLADLEKRASISEAQPA